MMMGRSMYNVVLRCIMQVVCTHGYVFPSSSSLSLFLLSYYHRDRVPHPGLKIDWGPWAITGIVVYCHCVVPQVYRPCD